MKGLRVAVNTTITFKNSQGSPVGGVLLKLSRNVIVLEVYNPYSIVQLSEVLNEVKILRGDKVIYNGKAVVNNLLNTGLMLIVSATLIDPWRDLTELSEPEKITNEIHHFIDDWEKNSHIRPGYQLVVSKIRSFLSDFHRWLEQFDFEHNKSLMPPFYNVIFPPFRDKLAELFGQLEEEIKLIPEESMNAHKAYTQSNIHPLILKSPFIHRTFYKPLGYAGDYEMVNMMLRDPCEGENLYTHLINSFYLQLSATIAHRNRIAMLENLIAERAQLAAFEGRTFRAFNIACGPAIELQRFVTAKPPSASHFDLLDFSEETLNHAKERITAANKYADQITFNFIFKSVHTLLKEASSSKLESGEKSYDLVYCAGLFDYLSDKVCARLLKLFYRWVKPGGMVIATNVHSGCDCRGTMEHIAEWYLIYRDEDQFQSLANSLGPSRVFAEETGINIFLEIRKPESGNA